MLESRNIPSLRFHEFDEEWTDKIFGDVVKINQGLQIAISERLTEEEHGSLFYITNEFLREDSKTKYFVKDAPDSVKCSEEDVLMTRTGNTGKVVTGVRGVFHNNFFKISFPNSVDRKFLVNFLNLPHTQNMILRLAGTSTIPDLNHSDFYSLKFIAPSLPEQQKIASFLTSVDTKIQQLTKKKSLLEQYKKGVMQKIFSQEIRFKDDNGKDYPDWEEKKLGGLIEVGSSKRVLQEDWKEKGIPFYRTREIISLSKEEEFKTPIFITEELYIELKEKYGVPKPGDLLATGVGSIGETYIVKSTDKFYFKDGNVIWFKVSGKVNSDFLMQSFKSRYIKKQLSDNASITTVATFTIDGAKKTIFKTPCLKEQAQIANFLSAIDDKIKLVSTQLENTQQFKKGLLQQMFV